MIGSAQGLKPESFFAINAAMKRRSSTVAFGSETKEK